MRSADESIPTSLPQGTINIPDGQFVTSFFGITDEKVDLISFTSTDGSALVCGSPLFSGEMIGPLSGWYLLGVDGHFSKDDGYLDRLELKVIMSTDA